MSKLWWVVGATVGGMAGWWLGRLVGPMTGYLASTVGTGLGVYWARRFVADHF